MSSEKKIILSVDQHTVVFPKDLIPAEIQQFSCTVRADGSLVLTPLDGALKPLRTQAKTGVSGESSEVFENVIDFNAARQRVQHRAHPQKPAACLAGKPSSDEPFNFVKLHLFSSRLEAEMVGEILKQSEIPYLIQSEDIGIFGPGASPVPGGVRMAVREADLDYARGLLAGLI